MRASPAFQVNLRYFGMWRSAVLVLAVMAVACALAWCASGSVSRSPSVWTLTICVTALLGWSAVQAARGPELSLRWDTLNWRLGPVAAVGEEPVAGQLKVVMDLGSWMLLRFVQTEPTVRRFGLRLPVCLSVQRLGLETTWHALRCAVYSSRPAKLGLAIDDTLPRANPAMTRE